MRLLLLIYLFVIAFTYKPGLIQIPINDWGALINYAISVLKTSAKWWFALILPYLYVISIEPVIKKRNQKEFKEF